jgi:hypothetical protein
MHYEVNNALKSYHNVRAMLKGIPEDLWDIFLPDSPNGLPILEGRILTFRSRESDRKKVIAIQKMCGFPLRPNAPLREMAAKVKILRMKKNRFESGGNLTDTAEAD